MVEVVLHDTLLRWLAGLEPGLTDLAQLSDGVVMARALARIEPLWFHPAWLAKIDPETGNSWRLKLSNLKKVLDRLVDYYQECLGQSLAERLRPDPTRVAERSDPEETGKFLQLVVGCAVSCEGKQEHIERIMEMEEGEQRALMECIQELEAGRGGGGSVVTSLEAAVAPPPGPELDRLQALLTQATLARDQLARHATHLQHQVALLQEEKSSLTEEKRKLMEEMESNIESGAGQLRKQLEAVKEELFKTEQSRDDYRLKGQLQEKEVAELRVRLEEAQRAAGEARRLKDELDILRETADKLDMYEATLDNYKKKLEETADLRRRVKQLEEDNDGLGGRNTQLEQELSKLSFWKSHYDEAKRLSVEAEQRLDQESKRCDGLRAELEAAHDGLSALTKERERLRLERDSLREAVEELQCVRLVGGSGDGAGRVEARLVELEQGLERERRRCAAFMEERDEGRRVVAELRAELATKQADLQEAEDRHRRNVDKAKATLLAIDPTIDLLHEVSMLRSQVAESQREQANSEALMTSAFHQLAAVKHRESGDQRLGSLGATGNTFLSRQRQQSLRRHTYNTK